MESDRDQQDDEGDMRLPFSKNRSKDHELAPILRIIPAKAEHADKMVEIWYAAYMGQGQARYKVTTNMCGSVLYSDKAGHVLVAELDGEICGWISLREFSEAPVSPTDARKPEPWQNTMWSLLITRIKQLNDAHSFKANMPNPEDRPDQVLSHLLVHELLKAVPELAEGPFLLLESTVVHPKMAHQGTGTRMVKWACTYAKSSKVWILAVVPEVARKLLEHTGFQILVQVQLVWAEKWKDAPGKDYYCLMAFDPR